MKHSKCTEGATKNERSFSALLVEKQRTYMLGLPPSYPTSPEFCSVIKESNITSRSPTRLACAFARGQVGDNGIQLWRLAYGDTQRFHRHLLPTHAKHPTRTPCASAARSAWKRARNAASLQRTAPQPARITPPMAYGAHTRALSQSARVKKRQLDWGNAQDVDNPLPAVRPRSGRLSPGLLHRRLA